MKVSQQITYRRESLGMSMKELADRVNVTEQAVRHWENGRSFPGKSKMRLVEQALSFTIDWTEGEAPQGGADNRTAAAMIDQKDVELLLVICKLPLRAKNLIAEFAQIHLEAVEAARSKGIELAKPALPPTLVAQAKGAPAPAPKTDVQKSRARATTKA